MDYLRPADAELKLPLTEEPMDVTAATMTTAMPTAMIAYSTAVAPL